MGVIYTTKSHTQDEPRFRVVIPLGEFVRADRYGRVVRYVEALLGGQFDSSTRRVTQFQRLPTFGATIRVAEGQPLDPARAPGATNHGEPLIPAGLRLFPVPEGPQVLGPVNASEPPALVAKLLNPEQAQRLSESERIGGLLGQVCVSVRDEFYIRQPNRNWVSGTRGNALSLLKEYWSRPRESGVEIEPNHILLFEQGFATQGGQLFGLVTGKPSPPFINLSLKSNMHSTVLEMAYRQWPSPSPIAGVSIASDTRFLSPGT
jgi:hypothetical protein